MAATRTRGGRSEPQAKPRTDVYTGLLIVAFLGMVGAAVLLWLDYSQYPDKKPPAGDLYKAQPGGGKVVPPAPAAGQNPPAPVQGGNPPG